MAPDPYARLYRGMLPFHNSFPEDGNADDDDDDQDKPRSLDATHAKMPQFGQHDQHVREHAQMTRHVDALERYCTLALRELRKGKGAAGAFEVQQMRILVGALEDTLLPHLQEEEESLKAENLKRAGFDQLAIKHLLYVAPEHGVLVIGDRYGARVMGI
ncbi:uncharacterized protein PSFLO_04755 [Pseudozyma flocculosa]|uniref:Uncharacterized protein n=1 Tax=Pseudozyma flocculosa TaxID=84751 RepID=A0A5C3F603_9BASI|nr:uncharacterized protein PSFLO_04755 [Pseudozyma flocculosa]